MSDSACDFEIIQTTMKKVLILAYDFPPYVSVGGLRPYNWYKYLPDFEVYPVVVTRQWSNKLGSALDYISASDSMETIVESSEKGTIVKAAYHPNWSNRLLLKYGESRFRLLRKGMTAFYEIAQFVLPVGPKRGVYRAARTYLKSNSVDVIIATGEPFVLFSYAAQLSKEFGIPWVADYRDPWSQNKGHQHNAILTAYYTAMEKRIVGSASQLLTVSELLQLKIGSLNPSVPIQIIQNGYDPEVIDAMAQIPQGKDVLQFAFVGTIYKWHPWKSVLKRYAEFIQKQPEARVKFNFYGINRVDELETFIETECPQIRSYIQIHPRIPNAVLLQQLAVNNVMILFNYYSFMGTKIFDYLGIRRRIVLCYGNDLEALALKQKYYDIEEVEGMSQQLQTDLIQETNAGIVVQEASQLVGVFEDLWNEFQQEKAIRCDSFHVEKYSRKLQVEKLATILRGL